MNKKQVFKRRSKIIMSIAKSQELEKKILNSEGDELSRALGEVFGCNHEPRLYGPYDDPPSTSIGCRHCGAYINDVTPEQRITFYTEHCKITIDPDNAFKWRVWAVEKFGAKIYSDAIITVWVNAAGGHESLDDFIAYAQPEHYLKAAAICEIRSKK